MVDPCVALYTKATILTSASRSLCSIVRAFGVLISFGRSTPHQIKNGGEAGTKDDVYKPRVQARRDCEVRRTGAVTGPPLHGITRPPALSYVARNGRGLSRWWSHPP